MLDLIERIRTIRAADTLLVLDLEFKEKILQKLPEGKAAELRTLLEYPEHTAGAFMNTEFLEIPPTISEL